MALEDPVAIHVQRDGDPAGPNQGPEEAEIAPGILGGDEGRAGQEVPGGVVQGADQAASGAPLAQPGVGAPVPEDEEAGLGLTRAATPVAGRPTMARAGHPRGPQQPVDGDPADRELLGGPELLGEVGGVQAGVLPPGERDDLLPRSLRQAMARGAAPVPVDEGAPPLVLEPGEEAPDMAETQTQTLRRLGSGDPVVGHQS